VFETRDIMRRGLSALAFCVTAVLAVSCSEEPSPMVASITYNTCTGRSGTCGDGDCCALSDARALGESYNVSCVIVPGSLDGSYVLNFSVATTRSSDPAIYGEGLSFSSSATSPSPVSGCTSLTIREGGNRFTTDSCDTNIDAGESGGCQVYLWEDGGTVEGRFRCNEIPLGSGNVVFSTVSGGGLDWGGMTIENCSLRL
jgi:hypothetical protein